MLILPLLTDPGRGREANQATVETYSYGPLVATSPTCFLLLIYPDMSVNKTLTFVSSLYTDPHSIFLLYLDAFLWHLNWEVVNSEVCFSMNTWNIFVQSQTMGSSRSVLRSPLFPSTSSLQYSCATYFTRLRYRCG